MNRPVVYDVFRLEPAMLDQLYDGVRSRMIGRQVVTLSYDASSSPARSGGAWIYSCPVVIFHRRGLREIGYRSESQEGRLTVGDGQVSLIPAGFALEVDYLEPCEGLVVGLAASLVSEVADELGEAFRFPLKFGLDDPALSGMAETFWHSSRSSGRFLDALGRALVVQVLEHHGGSLSTTPAVASLAIPEWLGRTTEHARRHLHRPISLDELADVAGLSRAHFARSFKRATGISPHDFLVRQRADRARDLIVEDPERSLAAVACASGFCDQSHLTSHFRRVFGITPAACRQARRTIVPCFRTIVQDRAGIASIE